MGIGHLVPESSGRVLTSPGMPEKFLDGYVAAEDLSQRRFKCSAYVSATPYPATYHDGMYYQHISAY
jgi:hypothetical protein